MEIEYTIHYHERVAHVDIPKLPPTEKTRIEKDILRKLRTNPNIYGKRLRQSLKGHWALRVGSYRVVYSIVGGVVNIFAIGHRSIIYEAAKHRSGY